MSASYQSEVETDTPFNDCPDIETTINNTAALNIDILLLGETGTGKDTLAQRIHCLSGRRGNFVAVNCAAIPESLAESQLFGVNSGAYTGAMQSRAGSVEAAHLGTLSGRKDSMPLPCKPVAAVLESRGSNAWARPVYPRRHAVMPMPAVLAEMVAQGPSGDCTFA